MTIKRVNTLTNPKSINLSGAAADYLLLPGETAYIDYSSASSIPLRVLAQAGLYELDLLGDNSSTITSATDVTLTPNSGGLAAGSIDICNHYGSVTTSGVAGTTGIAGTEATVFKIAVGRPCAIHAKICTQTAAKTVISHHMSMYSATGYEPASIFNSWLDTTTAWTSLGTVNLPYAQSGKIIIRRVI